MWLDQFGGVDPIVFYIFCGVSGLILILSLINLFLGCCVGRNNVSISCDFHLEVGCLCLVFGVLVRGLQLEWTTHQDLAIFCRIYHVVLLVGLTQFIGGLFVKGWTLFLFYKFNSDKRPLSEEWIPNLLIWLLILVIGAVSLVWVFMFTPMFDANNNVCVSPHQMEWRVGTSAWHGLLLLLAVVAIPANCTVTRYTPASAEAGILAAVTVNTVLSVVAGVCAHFLYTDSPDHAVNATVEYAIKGGLMLWMVLFADVMFLVSKVCGARNSAGNDSPDNYDTIDTGNRHSVTQANPSYDETLTNGKETGDFTY